MKRNDDVVEIDLWRLILVCLRRWWLILIVAVVFGTCGYMGSKMLTTPTYESTVKLYVNNSDISVGNIKVSASDMVISQELVYLYEVLLNTKDTLDRVIEEAGLSYNYRQVMGMLSTSPVNDTQVFRVTVTNTSPEEAQLIAATVARVLPEVLSEIVEGADARIVESPVVPTGPIWVNHSGKAVVWALIGAVLVAGICIVVELMDTTIKDENDLLEVIDVPVLTHIPDFNDSGKRLSRYARNYYKKES